MEHPTPSGQSATTARDLRDEEMKEFTKDWPMEGDAEDLYDYFDGELEE